MGKGGNQADSLIHYCRICVCIDPPLITVPSQINILQEKIEDVTETVL